MPELQVSRDFPELRDNLEALHDNAYPGRIALMGLSERGDVAIQAYAIMGRSIGSRSRIFVDEGLGSIRTTAPGKTQEEMAATENSELIYYQAAKAGEGVFIISNGAQTVPVYESILSGDNLDSAVKNSPTVNGVDLSKYEPDAPNFTPRITGLIDLRENAVTPFGLSVVTKEPEGDEPVHTTYVANDDVKNFVPGVGFAIQTYLSDGNPLPSFNREPYALPLGEGASSTAHKIWHLLNRDNRVALMTRSINLETGRIEVTCILNSPA